MSRVVVAVVLASPSWLGGLRAYTVAGQGAPVVLLHGDGGSVMDFTMSPVFGRLAERHHVIAIDRPGHGYSEAGDDAGSLRAQATIVHEALAVLGIDDPVLVGHSRGASVVAAYLDLRPGVWPLVGPLVVGTFHAPVTRFGDHALLRSSLDAALGAGGPAPTDLTLPLVVVHGDADRNVDPADAIRVHDAVPGSRLRLLEGVGHVPQFTNPDDVVDAIDEAVRLSR